MEDASTPSVEPPPVADAGAAPMDTDAPLPTPLVDAAKPEKKKKVKKIEVPCKGSHVSLKAWAR